MDTCVAFDYGQRKIGVAISHGNIALRLPFIANKHDFMDQIKAVIKKNKVTKIIIGIALNNNETDSRQSLYIRKFITTVTETFSLPVIIIEESLTTKIALENLKSLGFKKQQIANEKDSESARILLQEYLDETL